ncbi:MAG: c-type cytochrome [Pirellulaceae bacterium]
MENCGLTATVGYYRVAPLQQSSTISNSAGMSLKMFVNVHLRKLYLLCFLLCLQSLPILHNLGRADEPASDVAGPMKIARLLWNANKQSAGDTLSRAIATSLDRGNTKALISALEPMHPQIHAVVAAGNVDDPRFFGSLAAAAIADKQRIALLAEHLDALPSTSASHLDDRELLLRVWFYQSPETAQAAFSKKLTADIDPASAAIWIRRSLAADAIGASQAVLARWPELSQQVRIVAIEPLSSSANSMLALAEAVRQGTVNKDLVNTNQLRKWLTTSNTQLKAKIEAVWGKIRESENAERTALVARTLKLLSSKVSGSAARGNQVFIRVCSQCHQLHDQGFEVGPNISNNGRGNLEQLVSNVLDPSLVIGEAFQARTILTTDDEVVSGLVVAENDRFIKLKVQGGKIVEFSKADDIEEMKTSSKSLMPEGLETQLSEQELIDLFAYLCLLKPLGSEDNALISGTPDGLVEP